MWINSTLNCDAYSSFERVSSDHRIVLANIHLSLRRKMTQKVKASQYNWSSLTDIRNHYTVTVRKSLILFRHPKDILQIMNIKTLLPPIKKQQPSAYQPNQELKVEFHESQEHLEKKIDNMKKNIFTQ